MYRTIDASFWTDPKVRKLSFDGRGLLLYFITNPHTHVSGIYYIPRSTVSHETSLSSRTLDTLSDTLSSLGFCMFDAETDTVWVKNMMRYQGKGDKNIRSAAHHITKDLHKSTLIYQFLCAYPEIKPFVPDTLSIPYVVGATPHSPFPIPDSPLQNTENGTQIPAPLALVMRWFEILWIDYPQKDGKISAGRHFRATVHCEEDFRRCTLALANYKKHLTLHPKKEIKNGSTWFNNWQDWENWIEPESREPVSGNGSNRYTPEQIAETEEQLRARAECFLRVQGLEGGPVGTVEEVMERMRIAQ